jgi:hypothetical protein
MEINVEFNSDRTRENLINDSIMYFNQNKFKLQNQDKNILLFTRGNILLNFIAFNPLQWKSKIQIVIDDTLNNKITLKADINTAGQIITDHEKRLWNMFCENYKNAMMHEKEYFTDNKSQIKRTIKKNVIIILIILLVSLGVSISILFVLGILRLPV